MAPPWVDLPVTLIGTRNNLANPLYPGVIGASILSDSGSSFRMGYNGVNPGVGVIIGGRRVIPGGAKNLSNSLITIRLNYNFTLSSHLASISSFGGDFTTPSGVMFAIFDGSGNYRRWKLYGSETATSIFSLGFFRGCIDPSQVRTMQGESATPPNLSNIVAWEVHLQVAGAGTQNIILMDENTSIQQIPKLGATLGGGEIGNPASFNNLFGNYGTSIQSADDGGIINFPLNIAADYAFINSTFIKFRNLATDASDNYGGIHCDNNYGINLTLPNDATFILDKTLVAGSNLFDFNASNLGTNVTVQVASSLLLNARDISLDPQCEVTTTLFSGYESIDLDGSNIIACTFEGGLSGESFIIEDVGLIRSQIDSEGGAISFRDAPGDYTTSLILGLPGDQVFNMESGASGYYRFLGLSGGSGINPVIFDAIDGEDYTIEIGAELFAVVADPVTSGSVTIVAPVATTTFSGFPTADNSNGVAPAPVIGFYSSPSVEDFIGGLDTTSPEYHSGSFTVLLSDYPGVTHVVGDALGWVRTDYIPVDAANPPGSVSLAAAFREIVSETGVALVGNGTPLSMDKLEYEQSDALFEVAAGPIDFESALDKKEALTSPLTGLATFETTLVREIQFVSSKYGNEILLPAPLTIAAAPSAPSSPILTNFLVVRAGDPSADPFQHGLPSTAPGLDTRPEIRMISTLFIGEGSGAGSGGGGGLGPEDIERLERIEDHLTADIYKGRDRLLHRRRGTDDVILDKDVVYSPETGFSITDHQEPDP